MEIHNLTSAHLKQAIDLLSKKEALQEQLSSIDEQVAKLLGGGPITHPKASTPTAPFRNEKPAKVTRTRKAKGRGALKASIISALKAAGPSGVSIKDLVGRLNSKSANLHAWFNMTGKKVPGLEKIGRGIYRLVD